MGNFCFPAGPTGTAGQRLAAHSDLHEWGKRGKQKLALPLYLLRALFLCSSLQHGKKKKEKKRECFKVTAVVFGSGGSEAVSEVHQSGVQPQKDAIPQADGRVWGQDCDCHQVSSWVMFVPVVFQEDSWVVECTCLCPPDGFGSPACSTSVGVWLQTGDALQSLSCIFCRDKNQCAHRLFTDSLSLF